MTLISLMLLGQLFEIMYAGQTLGTINGVAVVVLINSTYSLFGKGIVGFDFGQFIQSIWGLFMIPAFLKVGLWSLLGLLLQGVYAAFGISILYNIGSMSVNFLQSIFHI